MIMISLSPFNISLLQWMTEAAVWQPKLRDPYTPFALWSRTITSVPALSQLLTSRMSFLPPSQQAVPEAATVYLRPLQVDNIFVFIRQVAAVPVCWLFKTSATSWLLKETLIFNASRICKCLFHAVTYHHCTSNTWVSPATTLTRVFRPWHWRPTPNITLSYTELKNSIGLWNYRKA